MEAAWVRCQGARAEQAWRYGASSARIELELEPRRELPSIKPSKAAAPRTLNRERRVCSGCALRWLVRSSTKWPLARRLASRRKATTWRSSRLLLVRALVGLVCLEAAGWGRPSRSARTLALCDSEMSAGCMSMRSHMLRHSSGKTAWKKASSEVLSSPDSSFETE